MPNTIPLKGDFYLKEGEASEAITPGHLVEFGGGADYRKHATIGGAARRAVALENDLIGKGIDDAYAAGDQVRVGLFIPGSEAYMILAAAETCNKGDALESAGNGRLQVSSTPIEGSIVGYAMEAQSSAGGRVKVEIY